MKAWENQKLIHVPGWAFRKQRSCHCLLKHRLTSNVTTVELASLLSGFVKPFPLPQPNKYCLKASKDYQIC